MRQTLAQIILPREHDKRKQFLISSSGVAYGFARVANAGGFTEDPLESSSLMMLTRRARRSGVDQAVVRFADPPPEQEGLRGEVPARRPSASHGRSMSCDSLWSLARSQRCPQRHLVDTAYRSPWKDLPEATLPTRPATVVLRDGSRKGFSVAYSQLWPKISKGGER
jgi:hypothetical protein